jgi:hypothetical protein
VKRCSRCNAFKSLDDFHKSARGAMGRQGYCKECVRDDLRERAARRPRKIRRSPSVPEGFKHCLDCGRTKPLEDFPLNKRTKSGRAQYCKLCHTKRGWESRTRLHGSTRHYHLMGRYGIGDADVAAMIEAQAGACAICQGSLDRPHVDHDHKTGKVRGILCFNCNAGLGKFGDDIDVMQAAVDYLRNQA